MKNNLIIIALLSLAGCSTIGIGTNEFQCGEGKTKNCASVMEAYRNSNGPDAGMSSAKGVEPRKATDLISTVPAMGAAIDDSNWPRPVLEPAQVQRIWIAPWVDEKESLHWPSYIYTEVKTRKWTFGAASFNGVKQLVPVQIERRTMPDTTTETKTETKSK